MRLKSVVEWVTKSGKRRRIRLYGAWQNMRARCAGTGRAGNGFAAWAGLQVEWLTYRQFRAWALANGYSKKNCSLDRVDPLKGYSADNCEWVTQAENTKRQKAYARRARRLAAGGFSHERQSSYQGGRVQKFTSGNSL